MVTPLATDTAKASIARPTAITIIEKKSTGDGMLNPVNTD
jgi:hypothetical protein